MVVSSSTNRIRHPSRFLYLVVILVATISILPTTTDAWPINTEPTHDAIFLGGNKKVVFLAGPHNSAYYSIRKFVGKWAVPYVKGHPRTRSLKNWRWGGDEIHKLITEPEEENTEIWELLKERFEDSDSNGVIVGSAFFDQIGPAALHDALSAMKKIIEYLGVTDPKDVVVVESYRTQRFDQWTSMWKHADGEYAESTYEDWLCDTHNKLDEQKKRLDMLGARTNPLGASLAYLKEGWEVKLLETAGMKQADVNIVQVVATQILQGHTEDGVIKRHEYAKPHANEGDREFSEFDDAATALAEDLFRYRDCAYQTDLTPYMADKSLEVLYNSSLFGTCDGSKMDLYQRLVDNPEIMYSALLRQLKCPNHDVDFAGHTTIGQALGSEKMTEAEKQEAGKHKIMQATDTNSSWSPFDFLQILVAGACGILVYRINLTRPLRKPEPPRRVPSMDGLDYDKDPELVEGSDAKASEMVKLAPSAGR